MFFTGLILYLGLSINNFNLKTDGSFHSSQDGNNHMAEVSDYLKHLAGSS